MRRSKELFRSLRGLNPGLNMVVGRPMEGCQIQGLNMVAGRPMERCQIQGRKVVGHPM
jgi:hypothetical protein